MLLKADKSMASSVTENQTWVNPREEIILRAGILIYCCGTGSGEHCPSPEA